MTEKRDPVRTVPGDQSAAAVRQVGDSGAMGKAIIEVERRTGPA